MAQLLSNLPNRALIKFGKHRVGSETAQPIVWMVADKNHSGYPSDSVTLITQKIIDLRAYDAIEGQDVESLETNVQYPSSCINQWLNSSAASNWFVKATSEDNPPDVYNTSYNTAYDSRPGFLYNFTQAERLAMLPTTLKLPLNVNQGTFTNISVKVFLPSIREVLGTNEVNDDSVRLQCFTSGEVRCGLSTQAYNNTTSTSKPSTVDSYWDYFTRSAANNDMYGVSSTGARTNIGTNNGSKGIRPIINLSSKTKVSDSVDSDGCYTVLSQTIPSISGSNSNIGVKTGAFSQTYTVADTDNDTVTVTEYLDNVRVRSYVATLGATNTFAITGTTWLKLANGIHTMKITATDGFDEVERTFTFTKSVTRLVVERAIPLTPGGVTALFQPKSIIVTVVKVIPENAIFKVEACNNGFDASPTWEDITTRVLQGRIYDFTNTTKTAISWGVNVRVTVDRNGSEGACYITEIGGNFE